MSGRKNTLPKVQIVSQGDMSQATVLSAIIDIQNMDNIGIQINMTSGTPSGTFDVTISADHWVVNGNILVPGTFIPIGSSYQQVVTSGSPNHIYFDLNQLSAPFIQLLWTKSSGSGAFDAFTVGKMI